MRRSAVVLLRVSSLLALVLVLAGCGGDGRSLRSDGGSTTSSSTASTSTAAAQGSASERDDLPFGLQRCPADGALVAAPEEWYRDEPVYVANEMPVEEVRRWASGQPGYQGIWIDRERNGWISVAFSEGAEDRQADLAQRFPDVGVVAVPVGWTEAELVELRDRAFAAMEEAGFDVGGSHGVHTGLVEVWVGELVEERLAPLARFAGQRLCVTGVEPDDVIRPGPQPESGDGWRLLGTDRTGASYRTAVATTAEQYAAVWREAGLGGEPPPVDFEHEVVIWFGAVYGSGCEIRMDEVVFDHERRLVHGDFVVPGVHQGCNDDANPEAYVVAVERASLPAAPFDVQLDADDPPAGAPEERTTVSEDLRSPGATIAG